MGQEGEYSASAVAEEGVPGRTSSTHGLQHQGSALTASQQQLQALKLQQSQYRDYIVTSIRISAGIDAPDGSSSSIASEEGLARVQAELAQHASVADIPRLVESVYLASSARTYLAALKAWAEAVRELERRCRDFSACNVSPPPPTPESAPAAPSPQPPLPFASALEAFSQAAYRAVEGLGAAMYAATVADYYGPPVAQAAPGLHEVAAVIRGRMQECRHTLHARLTEDAAQVLEALRWPPPMAAAAAPAAALPDAADAADAVRRASGEAASTACPGDVHSHVHPPHKDEFKGFNSDAARLAHLHALVACLCCLQQTVQQEEFQELRQSMQQANAASPEGSQEGAPPQMLEEGPVLWATSAVLVPPLQARLQAHFAPSTSAGRLDRPEWLFQTVLRLVQEHVSHVAALQPGLEAAGLGGLCHVSVEYARAMRDATKAVLRTARLPALQEAWEQEESEAAGELWRLQVQEAIQFEVKLAPFLGAPQSALTPGAALPDPLLAASVLRAITDDPEALGCWLAAEREGAVMRLRRVMDDPQSWAPPAPEEEDQAGFPPPSAQHLEGGWQREFNAPRVAEELVEIISGLVDMSRSMPDADAQKALLDGVGGPLLDLMVGRMTDMLEQAAASDSILSEAWAPLVGSCVAASRYLHHVLSELLEGPALSRLHAAAAAAAPAQAPGVAAEARQQLPSAPTAPQSPRTGGASDGIMVSQSKGGIGDVVLQHSFAPAPLTPPVLAAGVASLGSLHREWGLRIARELALTFGRAAVGYKEAVEAADSYPTHTGAAGTVTPILAPAMALLQAGLHTLAPCLDDPSFRDIWRAVAVPVNRFLFNYVATEAYFSPAGAHQFAVDCAGMVAVFSPFTKRPAAHFREMLAAARLLTLSDTEAAEVVRKASMQAVSGAPIWREPWLVQLGVGCLSAQQVVAVVERRL